jgi:hypothetical protein
MLYQDLNPFPNLLKSAFKKVGSENRFGKTWFPLTLLPGLKLGLSYWKNREKYTRIPTNGAKTGFKGIWRD